MRPSPTLFLVLLVLAGRSAPAQDQASPPPTTPADSIRTVKLDREAPLPRAERPTLSVLGFRYATVTNQDNYLPRVPEKLGRGTYITDPASLAHEDNQNIATGIAEMVKAELVEGQSFRILERQPARETEGFRPSDSVGAPDSGQANRREVPFARLIVSGAITRFGGEDRTIGGAGIFSQVLGGVGLKKKRTVVEITAQVLDASTGEVLLSVTGFGMSRKGGGLVVLGGTKNGVAGAGTAATHVAAEAIGEAARLAAQDLAAKITNARAELISALAVNQRN